MLPRLVQEHNRNIERIHHHRSVHAERVSENIAKQMVNHAVAGLEVDLQSNTQAGTRRSERNKHREVIERSHQNSRPARSQPAIDKPHNAHRRETHDVYRYRPKQDFQTRDHRCGHRLALHFRDDR